MKLKPLALLATLVILSGCSASDQSEEVPEEPSPTTFTVDELGEDVINPPDEPTAEGAGEIIGTEITFERAAITDDLEWDTEPISIKEINLNPKFVQAPIGCDAAETIKSVNQLGFVKCGERKIIGFSSSQELYSLTIPETDELVYWEVTDSLLLIVTSQDIEDGKLYTLTNVSPATSLVSSSKFFFNYEDEPPQFLITNKYPKIIAIKESGQVVFQNKTTGKSEAILHLEFIEGLEDFKAEGDMTDFIVNDDMIAVVFTQENGSGTVVSFPISNFDVESEIVTSIVVPGMLEAPSFAWKFKDFDPSSLTLYAESNGASLVSKQFESVTIPLEDLVPDQESTSVLVPQDEVLDGWSFVSGSSVFQETEEGSILIFPQGEFDEGSSTVITSAIYPPVVTSSNILWVASTDPVVVLLKKGT